jgi:tetratricopeptide (TPR) repeat protein
MLELVVGVDNAPATVAAVLPRMRRVVEGTTGTEDELRDRGVLAKVLVLAGRRDEAEREMRGIIAQAEARGEFGLASVAAGEVVELLRNGGDFDKALSVLEQKVEYTHRAGLGPWTVLGDESRGLMLRLLRGEREPVLSRVIELREKMRALPDPPGPNEKVFVWNVREMTLDIGRQAALELGNLQQALDFTAEILASKQNRGAPQLEQARSRYNAYGPLMELGRYEEVRTLLLACRAVFERENSIKDTGSIGV